MIPPPSKLILGLLGAPGSGKSFIAQQFAKLNCAVIDADRIAKAQLDAPEVCEQLVNWWGDQILTPGTPGTPGTPDQVDRAIVGEIVFRSKAELAKLEQLIHPRVQAERACLRAKYQADPAVVAIVEDVPLLLEKGLEDGCDRLIFVEAPREVRLKRVRQARGWTDEQLADRENNQLPLDIKRQRADDVIDNSRGEADAFEQVRQLLSQLFPKTR